MKVLYEMSLRDIKTIINGQMPLPVTLKGLLDVEIRKTQPVKQKQITLFEYMEKLSNIQLKVQE